MDGGLLVVGYCLEDGLVFGGVVVVDITVVEEWVEEVV